MISQSDLGGRIDRCFVTQKKLDHIDLAEVTSRVQWRVTSL